MRKWRGKVMHSRLPRRYGAEQEQQPGLLSPVPGSTIISQPVLHCIYFLSIVTVLNNTAFCDRFVLSPYHPLSLLSIHVFGHCRYLVPDQSASCISSYICCCFEANSETWDYFFGEPFTLFIGCWADSGVWKQRWPQECRCMWWSSRLHSPHSMAVRGCLLSELSRITSTMTVFCLSAYQRLDWVMLTELVKLFDYRFTLYSVLIGQFVLAACDSNLYLTETKTQSKKSNDLRDYFFI